MTWTKGLLGLGLLVLLVWGIYFGTRQAQALARATIAIHEAQTQGVKDSVALAGAEAARDSANVFAREVARQIGMVSQEVRASEARSEQLRIRDSIFRANVPPDTSAEALPYWKDRVVVQEAQIGELTSQVVGVRRMWHLDSLAWTAQRHADTTAFNAAMALSETRATLAEAALKAAGGRTGGLLGFYVKPCGFTGLTLHGSASGVGLCLTR
jgi:hypothetical protein